jgi:succinyl-diaminopimelate desuccinylase
MHLGTCGAFSAQDTLLWLCSIPSPTGEEQQICGEIAEYLRCCGVPNDHVRRYGNSLYVELSHGRSGPSIALIGHTDVVRTLHDAPPRIEGDRLYGPGASDMKSGCALMLGMAANPVATNSNLSLVLYASEEGPYVDNELGRVIEAEPSLRSLDMALVLEPTDHQLQLGCGGSLHAEVRFEGRSAHSARPWQGNNAIYNSLAVLSKLAALEPVPHSVEGLEWIASMSATMAQGGRAPNVIPDEFLVNVNARFGPDQSPEAVETEIRRLVGADGRVSIVDSSPPAPPHRSHPLVKRLELAGALQVAPKFGWTDVARFAQMGVAAVNFGPGCLSQAHQRNEWTSIGALNHTDVVLRRWLGDLPENCCL